MKKFIGLLIIVSLSTISLFADSGKMLAKQLNLNASSKAAIQWDRVFKKVRKMKRLGIHKLNDADKNALKNYLVSHSADSDTPEVAGI